jgi:hypothetical protein
MVQTPIGTVRHDPDVAVSEDLPAVRHVPGELVDGVRSCLVESEIPLYLDRRQSSLDVDAAAT